MERRCDVLIIGGGLGGVAAALSAVRLGKTVLMTEETDWIGGQLTSQAVPPDEGLWIEELGCTATYRQFREAVRDFYRRHYPLRPESKADPRLNPGAGNVSLLCHEPRVALAVLEAMLAPYRADRQLEVWLNTRPVQVHVEGDRVQAVVVEDTRSGERCALLAPYILDATETGQLLELGRVEHVVGAEGQAETGEPHALPQANPLNQQAVSWCFAMDYIEGEDFTIPKPAHYDFWRNYQAPFWPDKQLSWNLCHPITHQAVYRDLFGLSLIQSPSPRDKRQSRMPSSA